MRIILLVAAALAASLVLADPAPKKLWCNALRVSPFANRPAIISNGNVYVATEGIRGVEASPKNGSTVWATNLGLDAGCESPSAANGLVFYTASGSVVALDATTGAIKWTQQPPPWGAIVWHQQSLPVVDNVLFNTFTISASSIQAIDVTSGAELWINNYTGGSISNAVGFGTTVYITTPGSVIALDAKTGKTVFQCTTGCCQNSDGNVILASSTAGLVFFTGGGYLNTVDTKQQKCLWSHPAGQMWEMVVSADGSIVVGTTQTTQYAFEAATGKTLWTSSKLPCSNAALCHPDLSHSGTLWIGDIATLYGVDVKTGKVLTNISVPYQLSGAVSTNNGLVVVPTEGGVCAYQEATGVVMNDCLDSTCNACVPNIFPVGCQKEAGGTSVSRECTTSGLVLSAYTSSDCSGEPTTSQTYYKDVCYPGLTAGSVQLVSCPLQQ